MPKKAEYELMPIKPLKELKKEIQKLKNDLKKDDSSAKILTKVLNSNIEIQKKITSTLKELQKVSDNLKNVVEVIQIIESEEEPDLKDEIRELKNQNANILEQIRSLNNEIRRHKYFKERFPRGLNLVYQRTK